MKAELLNTRLPCLSQHIPFILKGILSSDLNQAWLQVSSSYEPSEVC